MNKFPINRNIKSNMSYMNQRIQNKSKKFYLFNSISIWIEILLNGI